MATLIFPFFVLLGAGRWIFPFFVLLEAGRWRWTLEADFPMAAAAGHWTLEESMKAALKLEGLSEYAYVQSSISGGAYLLQLRNNLYCYVIWSIPIQRHVAICIRACRK